MATSVENLIRYHNAQLTLRMIKKLVKHIPEHGKLLETAETRVQSFRPRKVPIFNDAETRAVRINLITKANEALRDMDIYIEEIDTNTANKSEKELTKIQKYVYSMKALAKDIMGEIHEMTIDEALSYVSSVYSYLTDVHLKLLSVKAFVDRRPFHEVCRSVVEYYLETLTSKKGKTPPTTAPLGAAIAPLGRAPVSKSGSVAAVFASPAAASVSGPAFSGPIAPTSSGVATLAPSASGLKTLRLEGSTAEDLVLLSTINENFTRLSEAIGKIKPKTKAATVGGRLRATRRCLKA